jgi:hypothetical protein
MRKHLLTSMVCVAVLYLGISHLNAHAAELRCISEIEFSPEENVLYYPVDLLCLSDTVRCVLNRGDGTIVLFDNQWRVLDRFGRLGEGPGELTGPTGLISWGDTLWVVTPRLLVGYRLDGTYLGERDIPWGLTSLRRYGDQLIGTWTGGSGGWGAAVLLDRSGDILETFGPRCDTSHIQGGAGFAVCLGWSILPGWREPYALVNHFQGDVLLYASSHDQGKRKHLGIGKGKLLSDWSFKSVINDVCVDPTGGYWVLTYKINGRANVCRFDESWELKDRYQLDSEVGQGVIRVLPDGTLCHVEEIASRLQVYERPAY